MPLIERSVFVFGMNSSIAPAVFEVNSPATVCGYSDRHAGFISSVNKSGTKVTFRYGTAKLLNGVDSGEKDALQFSPGGFVGHTSGTQRWEIKDTNEEASRTFTLRKNGKWIESGQTLTGGARLVAGHSHHYDYNF